MHSLPHLVHHGDEPPHFSCRERIPGAGDGIWSLATSNKTVHQRPHHKNLFSCIGKVGPKDTWGLGIMGKDVIQAKEVKEHGYRGRENNREIKSMVSEPLKTK